MYNNYCDPNAGLSSLRNVLSIDSEKTGHLLLFNIYYSKRVLINIAIRRQVCYRLGKEGADRERW